MSSRSKLAAWTVREHPAGRRYHFCTGGGPGIMDATATGVDPPARTVTLDDGTRLPYDRLVLTLGSVPDFLGIDGAERWTFPLKSVDDALGLPDGDRDIPLLVCDRSFAEDGSMPYPALVAANGEGDSSIAVVTHSAAKSGAGGCLGVAVHGRLGVAVKSWDGLGGVATVAAIAVLERLGVLVGEAPSRLETLARPPGWGRPGRNDAPFVIQSSENSSGVPCGAIFTTLTLGCGLAATRLTDGLTLTPVVYTFPAGSDATAIAVPLPRKVDQTRALPLGFSTLRNPAERQ